MPRLERLPQINRNTGKEAFMAKFRPWLEEIVPALRRALDENAKGRPAFLEFICSHHPVHGGWLRPA